MLAGEGSIHAPLDLSFLICGGCYYLQIILIFKEKVVLGEEF
jgi:hypothetical protein